MGEELIATLAVIASIFLLVITTIIVIFRLRIIAADKIAESSANEARQLDDRFSKLVSRLPGTVYQFQMDADGHMSFPYASDAIQSVHGVTPLEVKNDASAVFKVVHPEDIEDVMRTIRESAATLTVWRHEYRVRLVQGERWLLGNAMPDPLENGGVVWNGFITDVSEQKQAEARIHELAFYDNLTGLPSSPVRGPNGSGNGSIAPAGSVQRSAVC